MIQYNDRRILVSNPPKIIDEGRLDYHYRAKPQDRDYLYRFPRVVNASGSRI
jgi:hypothetical protein